MLEEHALLILKIPHEIVLFSFHKMTGIPYIFFLWFSTGWNNHRWWERWDNPIISVLTDHKRDRTKPTVFLMWCYSLMAVNYGLQHKGEETNYRQRKWYLKCEGYNMLYLLFGKSTKQHISWASFFIAKFLRQRH